MGLALGALCTLAPGFLKLSVYCPSLPRPECDPELWEAVHPPCRGLLALNFGQDL